MLAQLILLGIVMHLFCDFFLQNKFMSDHKNDLVHSWAGWLHGLIHFGGMLLLFPLGYALIIGVLHIVIDTRIPLVLWRKFYRQDAVTKDHAGSIAFGMLQDQAAHIIVITLVALLFVATLS